MPGTFSKSDVIDGKYLGTLHATMRERVATIERQMVLLHSLEDNAHGRIDCILERIELLSNAWQDLQLQIYNLENRHNKFVRDVSEQMQKLQMHIDTMPDGFKEELLQIHDAINELKTNGDKRPA
jgi:chromosome segregation ATPase